MATLISVVGASELTADQSGEYETLLDILRNLTFNHVCHNGIKKK